jgi:H+/Cl- antiporter ClcA
MCIINCWWNGGNIPYAKSLHNLHRKHTMSMTAVYYITKYISCSIVQFLVAVNWSEIVAIFIYIRFTNWILTQKYWSEFSAQTQYWLLLLLLLLLVLLLFTQGQDAASTRQYSQIVCAVLGLHYRRLYTMAVHICMTWWQPHEGRNM